MCSIAAATILCQDSPLCPPASHNPFYLQTRAPAPAAKAPAPSSASTATAAGDAPAVDRSIADLEPAPFRAYEPRTATTAVNRAEQKAHDVSEAAK